MVSMAIIVFVVFACYAQKAKGEEFPMDNVFLLSPPTTDQKRAAEGVTKQLGPHVTNDKTQKAWLLLDDGSKFELAPQLLELLISGLNAMGRGQGLRAIPFSRMVTTQQAAEIMGCSRQHVVNLIEEGELKANKIGTHRRIEFSDLLVFMKAEDEQRDETMGDIMEETARMGGYNT